MPLYSEQFYNINYKFWHKSKKNIQVLNVYLVLIIWISKDQIEKCKEPLKRADMSHSEMWSQGNPWGLTGEKIQEPSKERSVWIHTNACEFTKFMVKVPWAHQGCTCNAPRETSTALIISSHDCFNRLLAGALVSKSLPVPSITPTDLSNLIISQIKDCDPPPA